jgi:hypothetical protein
MRQFLELVVEQTVAGVQVKLALDIGDDGQTAEDDESHAT